MTAQPSDGQAVRQAIGWLVRLRSAGQDAAVRHACNEWRGTDPRHEAAWQQVQRLSAELDGSFQALPGDGVAFDALELSAQRLRRRQALKLLSASLAGTGGAWLLRDREPWLAWNADYATATGERREFPVDAATRLTLNSDSAVDLRRDGRRQRLILRQGEIRLERRASDAPPLQVQSAGRLLEVRDARFVLRQEAAFARLSVLRGQVALAPPAPRWPWETATAGASPLRVEAGEHYRIEAREAWRLARPPLEVEAWTDGLIVTRDMRLADFLAEVSRYRRGRLGCATAIADLRLSGVYRLDDTDALLALLARALPVRVRYRTRWWVEVEALA